jgi:hypothetical protein
MTQQSISTTTHSGSAQAALADALTFHASFDHGPEADFARGDKQLYSVGAEGELTPGLGNPPLAIISGQGRYGGALAFTQENSHVVVYKAAHNVAYAPGAFAGALSFWMNLDPAEIPGQYCDPVQITDKDYSNACIWVDFTKNDNPSDFRLGVFGNRSEWDVKNLAGQAQEFFWRLARVVEPPFAKGQWTHVVVSWDGINNTQHGRARLYFNSVYQGATGVIRERFDWDVTGTNIRLGTGHYVGLFDDIALFNRPLNAEEVGMVYGLERGVAELYG